MCGERCASAPSALDRLATLLRRYQADLPDTAKRSEDGKRIVAQAQAVLADVEAFRCVRSLQLRSVVRRGG